jgi:hypothetical protein
MPESATFVNRDMICLQALDQILRVSGRGVMHVAFDPRVGSHSLDDRASNAPSLGVPFDDVAAPEAFELPALGCARSS